ncbi:kynureninase [Naasia lichenicola]|nr:aminotransferase class V-fold PLP-dependent enzyme [Naasia lichenicola]
MQSNTLDAADPLAAFRARFIEAPDVVAYLDGNSLGRPLQVSIDALTEGATTAWAQRLIRSWDDGWIELPVTLGDRIAEAALGAAPGQTVVGDSTTVLLYKQVRAALALRPDRDELIVAVDDFPTDRYVLEGIAAERGATLRWIPSGDVSPDAVAALLGTRTAVVVLSHIAYRSGAIADVPAITALAHDVGALVIWDLSHSVGAFPIQLDEWDVDLAVGCSYKYLCGGPGAPAFAYVASRHLDEIRQPIQGWLGGAEPFAMGPGYRPGPGIRRMLSGTPPILSLLALGPAVDTVAEAGIERIREKSIALTEHAIGLADELLPDAILATPRDARRRGGHVTLDHPDFEAIMPKLWERGVIPDFRRPTGIRLGLSPLSTSFAEVESGIRAIAEELSEV